MTGYLSIYDHRQGARDNMDRLNDDATAVLLSKEMTGGVQHVLLGEGAPTTKMPTFLACV
jgi:hypothetical protein